MARKKTPRFQKKSKERLNFISTYFKYGKKCNIKSGCSQNQRKSRRYKNTQK